MTLGDQLRAQNAVLAAEETRARLTELRHPGWHSQRPGTPGCAAQPVAAQQATPVVQVQQLQSLVTLRAGTGRRLVSAAFHTMPPAWLTRQ